MELNSDVFLQHGTPQSDLQYWLKTVVPGFAQGNGPGVRAATPAEVAERIGSATHPVMLCDRTHLPRRVAAATCFVNPGSVGLPAYDDDHPYPHVIENGAPHARYALLEKLAKAGKSICAPCLTIIWRRLGLRPSVSVPTGRTRWRLGGCRIQALL